MIAAVCSWRWLQAAKAVLAVCSAFRAASPPHGAFLPTSPALLSSGLAPGTCPGLGLALTVPHGTPSSLSQRQGESIELAWESLAGLPVPGLAEPGSLAPAGQALAGIINQ